MRRPWTAPAAWEFVTALLASPGLAILVPTHRHADVAGEVILELPHLPVTYCTMRTRQFLCGSKALGESARGIPISINSRFWKS
jgi:hypothetical protein